MQILSSCMNKQRSNTVFLRLHIHCSTCFLITKVMKNLSVAFFLLSNISWALSAPFIIGGGDAEPNEFPYMAVILRYGEFICGGTLLTPRTVLTAWHCTWPYEASYSVRLGEHDRTRNESTEQTIAVSEIKPHPNADIDMAILVLEKPAVLNRWVKTAKLVNRDPIIGYPTTAIGWGWTKSGEQSMSSVLQKVIVPVQSSDACVQDGLSWINDKTQICAGFTIFRKYVNVYHRDSGSPLIIRDHRGRHPRVVGIVQGGHSGCAADKHMALFTRVTPFKKWIHDNMRVEHSAR